MKNILALLLVVLLAAACRHGAAQEVLSAPLDGGAGDLPPDAGFADPPLADQLPSGDPSVAGDDAGELIQPVPEDMQRTLEGNFGTYAYDPMQIAASCPSLFESSGTWLRRGFWYAEGDYMLINRSWDRKGLLFAFEGGVSTAPGFTLGGQPGFGPVLTLNTVIIEGSKPGADGMARVTLGRFLFRDAANRDHNFQATYFGGGNWKQSSNVTAATADGLQVNDFIDRVNPSFDGAERIAFDYETGLDSFETNYILKARMGRDQMVLQPDGNWVRTAQTSNTYSFLAGLRYVKFTDELNIVADRNPDVPTSGGGTYLIDCDNDLFGGQLGVSVAHETSRWSIGLNVKGGSFFNRMNVNSQFVAGAAVPSRGAIDSTEDNLSFVGEAEVLGKWHLRPNLSLRAGFELLYVESVALAPSQLNFVADGYPPIAAGGDSVMLGTALGVEAYR